MIEHRLESVPAVIQLPIGSEASFKGVIDLITMRALIWDETSDKGERYDIVDIPAEYGGLGLDKTTSMLIAEQFARVGSFAVSLGAHTGIGTMPILYFGTHAQKSSYLPDLAIGKRLAAYALTESGSGSDALAARTRADGVTATTSVWYGAAAASIVEVADATRADLIVMSTHGRSGLGRLLIGSVAESVVRATHTPILLLRPPTVPVVRPTARGHAMPPKEVSHV